MFCLLGVLCRCLCSVVLFVFLGFVCVGVCVL